jgi:hypothetical protein
VTTQTLQGVEGVSFAVPIFQILQYTANWTHCEGRMPAWGFTLQFRSEGFDEEHSCVLEHGAIVVSDYKELKQGDVVVSVCDGVNTTLVDRYGEIADNTRLSKTSCHSWPFVLSMNPKTTYLNVWRKGQAMQIKMAPCVQPVSAVSRFAEYDPVQWFAAGGFVFQELVTTVLDDEAELMNGSELLKIVHEVSKPVKKPQVVVSFIHPDSYVARHNIIRAYEMVTRVGRYNVKTLAGLHSEMKRVASRYNENVQSRLCITINGRKIHLSIDRLFDDETEHLKENPGVEGVFTVSI